MGLRYRRSIKILPGVRLNFNKKSISTTFGGKRFKTTVRANGSQTYSVNLPGKGLFYTGTVNNTKTGAVNNTKSKAQTVPQKECSPKFNKTCGVILIVISVLFALVFALPALIAVGPVGLLFVLPAAFFFRCGLHYVKKANKQLAAIPPQEQ